MDEKSCIKLSRGGINLLGVSQVESMACVYYEFRWRPAGGQSSWVKSFCMVPAEQFASGDTEWVEYLADTVRSMRMELEG